jgi:amino acid permease
MRRNVPIVGFIVGMLMPLLGFLVVYLLWFRGRDIGSVLSVILHDRHTAPKVLTLSLLANLIPFVYCNSKRLDYAMKGIVIATMLYALFVVFIMFVW